MSSTRSMGNSMSTRSFSTPARGMVQPSFGQSTSMHNAARQLNGNVSRSRGVSSLPGLDRGRAQVNGSRNRTPVGGGNPGKVGGNSQGRGSDRFSDAVKTRIGGIANKNAVGSRGADRITNMLGKSLNPKNSMRDNRTTSVDSFIKDRTNSHSVAKIDRSKLRDLVKGFDGVANRRPTGDRIGDHERGGAQDQLVDAIRRNRLPRFTSGSVLAGTATGSLGSEKNFAGGGCFPAHKHHHHPHHHNHGLGIHLSSFWFDHCHDHHYYDQCWKPYYTYPNCGVTFASYPEIVTVVDTQPIVIDEEITLEPAPDEETAENTADDESNPQGGVGAEVVLAAATDNEVQADEPSGKPSLENDSADVEVTQPATTGPAAEGSAREPKAQSEFDVELVNVKMLSAGDLNAKVGPQFQVTVRNAGTRDMEKFLVSLVACKDGQIDSSSLHTSMPVDQLAPGEEKVLELTLPVESLSLNRDAEGRLMPFSTLIAAVDSDERVNEGDEENNLALIDRTSMKLAGN